VDFDALRAAVVPGAGVVARLPGIVCVAECADRHVLRQLLDVCAAAAGPEPGRALARRLAMWLGGADAPGEGLRFGTVAVTGSDPRSAGQRGEWAVFLYGAVGLVVPDRQVALSGAQSVAWTDRLLPSPDAPVVLALEGGPIPPGLVDGVYDLRSGVVPGAGAVLVPAGEQPSGDAADEGSRTRPEDSRWLDAGGSDRQWDAEPASAASSDGLYSDGTAGNGLPSRGSLGALDGHHNGDSGDAGLERPTGRAHLRPVPSGSNGVAHRGWLPRRGSGVDLDHVSDPDRGGTSGPVEDDPADRADQRRVSGHDELFGPDGTGDGIGDERGRNGARGSGRILNGAAYDLLGGVPDAPPRESERSPWSDDRGRDAGRPERIEGWFATPDEGGTEGGPGAAGPTERRRRRHRLPDDDAVADGDPAEAHDGASGDLGDGGDDNASGDFGASPAAEPASDGGLFDSPSVEETRVGLGPIALPGGPPPDDQVPDGSADGTPRYGVPAQEAPPEPERPHPLADDGAERDSPRTTVLRSERILGAAPAEEERPALDDGPVTSGLVVDDGLDGHGRPPVGMLVFDDGSTYTVDAEYLMGRMPEADPRVASGSLRSLALEDTSGAVSRVHAQIVVNGWDALLVDVGSRNGTFVSPPGEQGWTQLPAGETHRLVPGTRVRIGGRSFQFEAPSGAR
jgi:FHA domain